jgi:ADP-ribose pyrophosphatase YjhB (NUDIX family)
VTTITCFDDHGRATAVPQSDITFSPAVYGVLLENNQVLLQANPETGLWRLPGGRVNGHEKPSQAVRRHFHAVSSITPLAGALLLSEEQYRVDRDGRGWHLAVLYYSVTRQTLGVRGLIDLEKSEGLEWLFLNDLAPERLQFGYPAIQLAGLRLGLL